MIKRHANIDNLKEVFPIENFDENNIEHWEQLHQQSIQSIVNNGGALPTIPPFEKHPYLEPLDVNTTATGLMIGTFPPITYLCDLVKKNKLTFKGKSSRGLKQTSINYFHGNKGSLWQYAPIGFDQIHLEKRDAQPQLIIDALNAAGVLYTDIIKYTQRELNGNKYDAGDKNLNTIIPNSQVFQFLKVSSIERLYFTNANFFHKDNKLFDGQGLLRLQERDAFGLFLKTAIDLNIKVEYSLWGQENWVELNEQPKPLYIRNVIHNDLTSKVVLRLRLTFGEVKNVYSICSAVSPAAVNRGLVRRNPCVQKFYGRLEIPIAEAPAGLLSTTLDCFFKNNLNALADFNV